MRAPQRRRHSASYDIPDSRNERKIGNMTTSRIDIDSRRPNVVIVLLDDLGYAQFGCYGSDIASPNIDQLAENGLRYNKFHVTALCSPTRASLLTGRNHHAVGMGFLADMPMKSRGYTSRIPAAAATLPRLLRNAGYSTMAVGKWHLIPRGDRSAAGPFDQWPLGLGFERYYGFLRGDANHWAPELVRDNSYVQPPAGPDEGYHLTEDLTDEAIRMVVNQQESAPGKPFFLYFAAGAMHAPHHVERSWADAYARQFDKGWDRWREEVFHRQLESGVVPAGTILTARPPWVPSWGELSLDERRLYARMHEVYAGFLSHTDAQIGRLMRALERMDALDNTLFIVLSDNGASAEGGVRGTSNEHRFTHRVPDDLSENMAKLEDWGGIRDYPHYAWGWAWAGNTPFRLWKRYAWLGGTRVPMIVHWPAMIAKPGAVRSQFGHAIDILPTVLEACGAHAPDEVGGVPQMPIDGASMFATLNDPNAPDPRSSQYFEMLGSRSMVSDGWKATTDHVSQGVADEEKLLHGSHDFLSDRWSLFRLEDDFSEAVDLADNHPDIVARLEHMWEAEAERNGVRPMSDGLVDRIADLAPLRYPAPKSALFYPDGGPVSDEALPSLFGGGRLVADVEVPHHSSGVVFAIGDWNSGLAVFVIDGQLQAALALPGDVVSVSAGRKLAAGVARLGCQLRPAAQGVDLDLMIDDEVVATSHSAIALPMVWQHGGSSLTLGYDVGLPVCDRYWPPFAWNGEMAYVEINAGHHDAPPLDALRLAIELD
jgi:arylsulfatase A-like enzyme